MPGPGDQLLFCIDFLQDSFPLLMVIPVPVYLHNNSGRFTIIGYEIVPYQWGTQDLLPGHCQRIRRTGNMIKDRF